MRTNNHPVLIVGGDSVLGQNLVITCNRLGYRVYQTTRNKTKTGPRTGFLDMAEDPGLWQIPQEDFDAAIICAAVTSMQKCHDDPDATRHINVVRTVAVSKKLADLGIFVVFPSTNAVFDGNKPFAGLMDPVCPTTEYGRQKAESEKHILASGGAVVRLGKIVHPNMPLFRSWIADLKDGKIIRPFADLIFSPVSLEAAVNLILKITREKSGGIFQLSGQEDISYADAAKWFAARLGVKHSLIQPVSATTRSPHINRPRHATLAKNFLEQEFIPIGWETLERMYCEFGVE
ncbi:MAG: NAD(P)-dependent oxidoreductase [Desulfatirhabdiaceae bacterium]